MVIKIGNININNILSSFEKLNKDIIWGDVEHIGKQSGLQYKKGENPWLSSVGKKKNMDLEYTEINPFFKNTIFEDIIKKYDLKRTRLMWMTPKSSYSIHTDAYARLHIPLITNKECFFIFKEGIQFHLSVGHVWWVNTKLNHTYLNFSDNSRLHLVGVFNK